VKGILLLRKIAEVTNSKCSAFASSVLLRLFFTSNSTVLIDESARIIFFTRAQGTVATPLLSHKHCNLSHFYEMYIIWLLFGKEIDL